MAAKAILRIEVLSVPAISTRERVGVCDSEVYGVKLNLWRERPLRPNRTFVRFLPNVLPAGWLLPADTAGCSPEMGLHARGLQSGFPAGKQAFWSLHR
jgi:hypothetical protein